VTCYRQQRGAEKKRLKKTVFSTQLDIIKAPLACQENRKPTDQELKTYPSPQSSHSKPLLMLIQESRTHRRSLADLLVWEERWVLTQSRRGCDSEDEEGDGELCSLALKIREDSDLQLFASNFCNEHMMLPTCCRGERDREENKRPRTYFGTLKKEHFRHHGIESEGAGKEGVYISEKLVCQDGLGEGKRRFR